jgi:hypothetical protein
MSVTLKKKLKYVVSIFIRSYLLGVIIGCTVVACMKLVGV